MLAQHIPVLSYTLLSSHWELLHGFTEPFIRGVVIPLMNSCLCSFSCHCWSSTPSCTSAVRRCLLSTNCRLLTIDMWQIWHSEDRVSWYILIIKANEMHYFSSLFLIKNSTCFRQIYCPSSGVSTLYTQQLVFVKLVMLTVC